MSCPLTVGQLASRSGVTVSTLHFYESEGLIRSWRTSGNQRRYSRETLRRVAFIRISQKLGISLARIQEALALLPEGRTPHQEDWARLSTAWRDELDQRIEQLRRLRDNLTGCIGCGCLSLKSCRLANPYDVLGQQGPGPRRLLVLNAEDSACTTDSSGNCFCPDQSNIDTVTIPVPRAKSKKALVKR